MNNEWKPANGKPVMVRVAEKKMEAPDFATLYFDHAMDFQPGRFIMVWIPGLDEKPYTVSFHKPQRFGITVEAKGLFSKKALTLEKGDPVGFRGPFGQGFDIRPGQRSLVVAGGCGMAPLAVLLDLLPSDTTTVIHGARSKNLLLFPDRFSSERRFCTDDGSFGHKGRVTDLLKQTLADERRVDMVYACGPEIMMYQVFSTCEAEGIPCQVSLERYMRCGFGVCGACVCGPQRVCQDGPVFHSQTLRSMKDFNTRALLKSGKQVDIARYFSWRCV